jgi:hypothetical protein
VVGTTGDSRVLKTQDNRGQLERWLVILISLHSYAVGFGLIFLTEFGARLGGWEEVVPLFFARQAGVFHFLVATAYLLEYFRHGTVTMLLITKTTAFFFLGAMIVFEPGVWIVPLSAVGDGLMGLVVWLVHRRQG